ncbi:hypothetical protein PCE1_004197 [Barthelona sp. PCE]
MSRCIVNITEKPSMARLIAKTLSEQSQGSELRKLSTGLKKNPVFSITQFKLGASFVRFKVTSVSGNPWRLEFKKNARICSPSEMIAGGTSQVEFMVKDKMKSIVSQLKRLISQAKTTGVFIWTDLDREGELLAHLIENFVHAENKTVAVRRIPISCLTSEGITSALTQQRPVIQTWVDAALCRKYADFIGGCALSRYASRPFRAQKITVSVGPCQIPALKLVSNFYDGISRHVGTYKLALPEINGVWDNEATANHRLASGLADLTQKDVDTGHLCVVDMTSGVLKTKERPLPPKTSGTLIMVAKELRLSASKTMVLLQQLYESGLISYVRTESTAYSEALGVEYFKSIVHSLTKSPLLFGKFSHISDEDMLFVPRRGVYDGVHEPIHPLIFAERRFKKLNNDCQQAFLIIVKNFFASISHNETYISKRYTLETDYQRFFVDTKSGICPGYTLFKSGKETNSDQGWSIGHVVLTNVSVRKTNAKVVGFKEYDWLCAMEQAGIGTQASMVGIIKKLFERKYVTSDNKRNVCLTKLGATLLNTLEASAYVTDPGKRGAFEEKLVSIETGLIGIDTVLQEELVHYASQLECLEQTNILHSALETTLFPS